MLWWWRAVRADGTAHPHTTTPRRRWQSEKWALHDFFFAAAIALVHNASRRKEALGSRLDRTLISTRMRRSASGWQSRVGRSKD
jgi:hypothetical protein